MFPELKIGFPPVVLTAVTVWATTSLLVQFTVLLMPIITVMLSGAYPGAPLGLPAPFGMETCTMTPGAVEEVELVVVVVAPLGTLGNWYEELFANPLTRKYPRRIGMIMAMIPITPSVSLGA